jgi:hypothetical protein
MTKADPGFGIERYRKLLAEATDEKKRLALDVRSVTETPGRAVDYVFKTIVRRRVSAKIRSWLKRPNLVMFVGLWSSRKCIIRFSLTHFIRDRSSCRNARRRLGDATVYPCERRRCAATAALMTSFRTRPCSGATSTRSGSWPIPLPSPRTALAATCPAKSSGFR